MAVAGVHRSCADECDRGRRSYRARSRLRPVIHGEEGNLTFTDLTFEVQTLSADGGGTARLTDGTDVFNYRIQVSPDRSTIGVAGVDPASEDMFAGFFVHQ